MLGRDQAILEGWTTLSALAGATRRARLGIIHQANLFRPPALTAKMTATLDQLSDGRFIFFTDAGWARHEHVAYGLPWSDEVEDRLDRFEEGLNITLGLWKSREPFSYSGKHYTTQNALCAPAPAQKPHPPVWIGSTIGRMHDLCARYAQGWNTTPISIEGLRIRLGELEDACRRAGRAFDEIEKTLEIQILIAPDLDGLRRKILDMIGLDPELRPVDDALQAFLGGDTDEMPEEMRTTWLAGTPDQVAGRIDAYVREGVTHFMLWFIDAPSDEGLRLFADAVAPRYR
jgi:alkanesulfonate monooxygenase SsuD/methylene tetrahydromethanopterin reductase-like flavin-dependent oxidoreductase (luciferase family)